MFKLYKTLKLVESQNQQQPSFAKQIFKLVFVLYKLRKGVEPLDVAKLMLKLDPRAESHLSVCQTTEGIENDCSLTWAGGSQPNVVDLNS